MPRIVRRSPTSPLTGQQAGGTPSRVTRRQALRTLGTFLAAASAAAVLQACGAPSSPAAPPKSSSSGTAGTGAGEKPTTAPPAQGASAQAGAATPASQTQPASKATAVSKAPATRTGTTEFIAAIENPPPTLDHQTEPSLWGFCGVEIVQDGIVGEDRDFKPVPALAESWENPNPTTWNFKLRSGVKFHNGKELSADDVVYTLNRLMDPKTGSSFRPAHQAIEKVEAVDKLTVRLTLSQPYPSIIGVLADGRGSLVMPAGAAESMNLKTEAVGTGPFRLVEYVPNSHATYERFPDYWRAGYPKIDRVTIKAVKEEPARLAALRTGSVTYADFLTQESTSLLANDASIRVTASPGGTTMGLWLNQSHEPFGDARVRRALSMALNRHEIIEKVEPTGAISGSIPVLSYPFALKEDELPPWFVKPDLEQARKLLAEAGYPNGFKTTITTSNRPIHADTSVVARENWKKIGVDAEIHQLEFALWNKETGAAGGYKFDIKPQGYIVLPDPLAGHQPFYHSNGSNNIGKAYKNPRMDEVLTALATASGSERDTLFREFQHIAEDDALILRCFQARYVEAMSASLQGYYSVNMKRRNGLTEAWFA
ncbi:MAG: hypothetical protein IT305_05970 [Chloroflexi bacterium]|nr:hypothetical protein [Chloroflexota bacterium]